jgi:flagella basal body P-ring formation protein FlgA
MKTLAGALCLWGGLFLGPARAHAAVVAPEAQTLTLRVTGTAHGPNVLMKDVIEEELPEPLASVALKAAGRPGGQVSVPRFLAQVKLRAEQGQAWSVAGGTECLLSVPVQHIPGLQIQKFAGDFLAAQLSGTAGVSMEAQGVPLDLETYEAPTRFLIQPGTQDWRGNVVLRVQVMQPGPGDADKEVASVPVSYLVKRQEPRVYAVRPLRKGDPLDPAALVLHTEDTTFMQGQGFSSLEELAGKRARAYIAPGRAVTADLVELPPLIRRGDIVRLLVKSGGIVVETQGKALRDARVGESLPLEVEGTNSQVQARCVDVDVAVREAY